MVDSMATDRKSWLWRLGLHRKELRAWAMYDWADSAFATTMMASVLPIYYHDVAANGLPEHLRTAYWGYSTGLALALVAAVSPILGALADQRRIKKLLLACFAAVGSCGSIAMASVGEGEWLWASLLFLIGNIGFAGSNVFYDALLPYIAHDDEVDRVSTAGYAMGYVGGGLLLALNLAWIQLPDTFGFADKGQAVRASFVSVGIWWMVFTLPLLRHVREPRLDASQAMAGNPVVVAFKRLAATARQVGQFRDVIIFLFSFWFFTDGIGTIIKMATIFGREIGIGQTHLIGALLLVQFLGIPATFAFGALADRIGTKAAIQLALAVYTGICVLGYFMTEAWHFWMLAVLVAMVQGGSQALSRSLFAAITPIHKANEFFAFVSISARFAGIFGPLIFGVVSATTGGSRASILFLVFFFLAGMGLLALVNIPRGRAAARAAEAAAGVDPSAVRA